MKTARTAARVLLVITLLTGVVYPIVITGIAQVIFPGNANGSLVSRDGHVVGSALVGQQFTGAKYFWSRLSSTNHSAMPSGGSNLGPTSVNLRQQIDTRRAQLQQTPHEPGFRMPWDMICASGSGLDPDISPEAARFQVTRVAQARGLDSAASALVLELVERHMEQPSWGVLGAVRINVLELNLALDSLDEARR